MFVFFDIIKQKRINMNTKGYVEYRGDIGPIKAGWPDLGTCNKLGDGGDALMANTEWPPALMANTDWPPFASANTDWPPL